MVQVVDTKAGIGAYLGQGFASGVEKGMERQSKLQEMMQKQALKDQSKLREMSAMSRMVDGDYKGAMEILSNPSSRASVTSSATNAPPAKPIQTAVAPEVGSKETQQSGTGQRPDFASQRHNAQVFSSYYPEQAKVLLTAIDQEERAWQHQEEQKQKKFDTEREYHKAGAEEARKEYTQIQENLAKVDLSIKMAEDAIESGDVGALSPSNIGERLGIHEFQTLAGAQLAGAGKENLFGNLSKVAAKGQNVYVEQRISSFFPEVGKSREANLEFLVFKKAEKETLQNYSKQYERIEQEDMKEYGFVRNNISARAWNAAEADNNIVLDRASYRSRVLYEQEKGREWVDKNATKQVKNKTPLTPYALDAIMRTKKLDLEGAQKEALRLGYKLPSKEDRSDA